VSCVLFDLKNAKGTGIAHHCNYSLRHVNQVSGRGSSEPELREEEVEVELLFLVRLLVLLNEVLAHLLGQLRALRERESAGALLDGRALLALEVLGLLGGLGGRLGLLEGVLEDAFDLVEGAAGAAGGGVARVHDVVDVVVLDEALHRVDSLGDLLLVHLLADLLRVAVDAGD
jgi:hypothetical protein